MKRPVVIALVMTVAGAAAILLLLAMRFAAGDVYPRYSSLRADPLGTKVLYDSLARMPGLKVSRNHLADFTGEGATVLYFGISCEALIAAEEARVRCERTAKRANRLVLTLEPLYRDPADKSALEIKPWGLRIEQDRDEDGGGPLWFADSKDWTVLWRENRKAVLVERSFGKGSIVLASGDAPFLNKALANDRRTPMIVRAIGPASRVVFDEAHLGVVEAGSVVGLARKYRLDGLIAGLLVLAALFLWKSAAVFPPPREPVAPSGAVAGRASLAGFVNLLRRNVPPKQVLELGWNEWRRSQGRTVTTEEAAAVESILRTENDAVAAYRRCQAYLTEKKRIGKNTRV